MPATTQNIVTFDADLIARYDGRGPRYTSYPAAPEFSTGFTVADYREFAARSNKTDRPLSIYVHIPFCNSLCYYCGCNKIVTRSQDRIAGYLDNLHREIDMQAGLFAPTRPVQQLHLGGGTPTYIKNQQLRELIQKLGSAFSFAPRGEREFSIEVDPRTVDASSIALHAELGFNRLSLGVQDFDPAVQQAVNRVQSEEQIAALLAAARSNNFNSVSFDLIYGLPQQTEESFARTLRSVIEMRPDRLAVYNYAHLPARFKGQRMIDADQIPAPAVKLQLLQMTIERLQEAGYCYVGMDHFALPEDDLVRARESRTLQRNFQGYSTHRGCDLVGLGVSSISQIGSSYSQNTTTTKEYEALIDSGRLPVCLGIAIDKDDLVRADVIQTLMCYDEIVFAEFDSQHELSFRDYFAKELANLAPHLADGLVELDLHRLRVSPRGRLLMRNIAMQFDRHLDHAAEIERFSKAI